jgi:SAM-dependent methyltransferase
VDARGWDDRYQSTDRLWSAEPNVFVADRLSGLKPGVGLDIASGEGRNAIWLAGLGWDMTAVDFSEVAIERGRGRSQEVDFVVADVLTWDPEREYDLIIVAYLQVVEDKLASLVKRSTSWLAPGGVLFLIGHDESNLEHGVGGPQYPEVLWRVDRIVEWLEGLELVEARVVDREVEVDDGVAVARDALVMARARPD